MPYVMDQEHHSTTEATIMTALATLSPPQLSDFTHTISALFRSRQSRLSTLLSSPAIFSLALLYLHSLSRSSKSLLIARDLLSTLAPLSLILHPTVAALPLSPTKLRDLDAALILILLCEVRQHDPHALETPIPNWRIILCKYLSGSLLTLSHMSGSSNSDVLSRYITTVAKCRNFMCAMGFSSGRRRRETAAAKAAVLALPSVEVVKGGKECVVCKEEMREGRDVCEMPCAHLFHWMCILPWLEERNTCPCCRYRLPSKDVPGEIDRLWELIEDWCRYLQL